MSRGRRIVWILLVAAVVGWIVIPRVRVRIRSEGQSRDATPATAEAQLEEAVAATMGTILGTERSENLSLVIGAPLTPTVEGIYIVAYVGVEGTERDRFSIAVSDADSGADCLCAAVWLGRGPRRASVPSPQCTVPAERYHELMTGLHASIQEWQVPRLGPRPSVNAILVHPPPKRVSIKLTRTTNHEAGRAEFLGPAVEQVVVIVEPR